MSGTDDTLEHNVEKRLVLKALGENNIGNFEVEHEGLEWYSFYADKVCADPVVAMGIKCATTGNSVTLGQVVSILMKGIRLRHEFYFLGAFWAENGEGMSAM